MKVLQFTILLVFLTLVSQAQVRLPRLIRDSMILQRDEKINIWGWASASEKVRLIFQGRIYVTKADAAGNWKIQLGPVAAGGPFTMTIRARNTIHLRDILFGDVWFCSGQSNMVHQLNIHDITYAKDIATADFPQIRQFWIPTFTALTGPQTDLSTGSWKAAVGEDVRPFSAVAYFFARQLHEKYKVPIGIINASVGGTPIESWTSETGMKDFAAIQQTIQQNKDSSWVNSSIQKSTLSNPSPFPDAGLAEPVKWFETNYIMKGWRNISIPGYWEDQGIKNLDGVVWYRKEIDIPAAMTGKTAKVFLGRIVDADELYINGTKVGNNTYQYPQRRYPVSANILKEGKNIVVIRVTNYSGKGGFVPDKPYYIFTGSDTISLSGNWWYKVGQVNRPMLSNPIFSAQNQPTSLFNGMVAPATRYNIKGICWYQGESNTSRPKEYAQLLPALIRDWRDQWNKQTLPFLTVQLPGFMDYNYLPSESQWAETREAQMRSLSVPNTGLVVTIDLGEWNDIHPDNKKDVGIRLAIAAQKVAYSDRLVHSGPVLQISKIVGKEFWLSFTNTGSGLATRDGEDPAEFAIAGEDKKFVWAKTKIEDANTIRVWSDEVPVPKYVRYAWADNPVNPNLINKEGLPASPFRAGE
jgi:sialate O-acetylesterase